MPDLDPDQLFSDSASDDQDLRRFRKSRVPLYAALSAVVLGALAAGLYALLAPVELAGDGVLVVVSGIDAATDARVQKELAAKLSEQGFWTVPGEDEKGNARTSPLGESPTIDEARQAARKLGTAHIVFATLSLSADRPGLTPGNQFFTGSALAQVHATDEAEPATKPQQINFATERRDKSDALEVMASPFAEALFPFVAEELFDRKATQQMLTDGANLDALVKAGRFRFAKEALARRRQEVSKFQGSCDAADAALADLEKSGVTCISAGCGEEYLSGISPNGKSLLVRVETATAIFPFKDPSVAMRFETPERLELVDAQSGKRRTLAVAQNFYTYPELSANGRTVVFVEKADARYAVVSLDVESGTRVTLYGIDWPGQVQSPRVSADGKLISFYLRKTKFGDGVLAVIPSDGGELRRVAELPLDYRWLSLELPGGGERQLLAVVSRPKAERADADPDAEDDVDPSSEPAARPRARVTLIDPVSAESVAEIADEQREMDEVLGAKQGSVLVSYRSDSACGVLEFELANKSSSYHELESCPRDLSLLPDGRLIGEMRARGVLGVYNLNPKAVRVVPLTRSRQRERYPRVARRSGRVAFELLLRREYRDFPRSAVCFTDKLP